ncbi:MAG: hypothetical protein WCA44_04030 [Acidobacteriaceae bacterium]
MSAKFSAEVEIVLAGYEDLSDAGDELDRAMLEMGFVKDVLYYRGPSEALPTELEEEIRGRLAGKLTLSGGFTVHVVNQGAKITRH